MAQIVIFQLNRSREAYGEFFKVIESYPKNAPLTENCWVISSVDPCDVVRDKLEAQVEKNIDRVVVADLAALIAWSNVECGNGALIDIISKPADEEESKDTTVK